MRRTVIRIVAVIGIITAWSLIGLSLSGGIGPRMDVRPHEASGRIMAEQALALVAPGGQITVITRDTAVFKNPATDLQLASFRRAIEHAKATVRTVHGLQVDPLRPVQVPSGDFCEMIRQIPKGDVIVSFLGPPLLSEPERIRLGEIKPAIVAFCSGRLAESVDFRSLFEQGLLRTAVVDRRDATWSEQSFQILTAGNPAAVAGARGGGNR